MHLDTLSAPMPTLPCLAREPVRQIPPSLHPTPGACVLYTGAPGPPPRPGNPFATPTAASMTGKAGPVEGPPPSGGTATVAPPPAPASTASSAPPPGAGSTGSRFGSFRVDAPLVRVGARARALQRRKAGGARYLVLSIPPPASTPTSTAPSAKTTSVGSSHLLPHCTPSTGGRRGDWWGGG
jgi:hypothetical protein